MHLAVVVKKQIHPSRLGPELRQTIAVCETVRTWQMIAAVYKRLWPVLTAAPCWNLQNADGDGSLEASKAGIACRVCNEEKSRKIVLRKETRNKQFFGPQIQCIAACWGLRVLARLIGQIMRR